MARRAQAFERLRWRALALSLLALVCAGYWVTRDDSMTPVLVAVNQRVEGDARGHDASRRAAHSTAVTSAVFGTELAPGAAGALPVNHAPGTAAVCGRVLDATGGAVSGASVTAQVRGDGPRVTSGASDSGEFCLSVRPGPVQVTARADAYSQEVRDVVAPDMGLSFSLAPESVITGVVIAEDTRQRVSRATVTATNGVSVRPRVVQAAADGTFTLPALSAGRYALVAETADAKSSEHWVDVAVADVVEGVTLALAPATLLRAALRVAGAACPSGRLELTGPVSRDVELTADGSVEVSGLPHGEYRVHAHCAGAQSRIESVQLERPTARVWDLDVGEVVRGTVTIGDGGTRAGVRVDVNPTSDSPDGPNVSCLTGADGRFACGGLVPGEYTCHASLSAGQRSPAVRVSIRPGAAPDVLLRLAPSASLRVKVEGLSPASDAPAIVASRAATAPIAATRAGDAFVFEALELGVYEVYAEQAPQTRVPAVLDRAGEELLVQLPLRASASISGRVLDDRGNPLPDAWIRVEPAAPRAGDGARAAPSVLTDADGAFVVGGLFATDYVVWATAVTGEAPRLRVEAGSRGIELRLTAYGSLSGSVSNPDGTRAREFELLYQSAHDDQVHRRQAANGSWSLPWQRPGKYRLIFISPSGTAERDVELRPSEDVHLSVRLDQATEGDPVARFLSEGIGMPEGRDDVHALDE